MQNKFTPTQQEIDAVLMEAAYILIQSEQARQMEYVR